MNEIDQEKIQIRPVILAALINESMSFEEQFQNATLRPIIKLQHDLLFEILKNYFKTSKINFRNLSTPDKRQFVSNNLMKDSALKNELLGIIIGFFTLDEYTAYKSQQSELNKRIISIIKERINSNLDLLNR